MKNVEKFLANSPCFFLNHIGPTLAILSNFSSTKAVALLKPLSKQARQFCETQKQGIFRHCHPTILTARMTELPPITNLKPLRIVRILHLRENLFLIGYAQCGCIQLRDLSDSKAGRPIV